MTHTHRRQNTCKSIVSNADSFASYISGKIQATRQRFDSITRTSRVTSQKARGVKRINQYIIKQTIGTGSYGKVKLCMNVKNKKVYAKSVTVQSRVQVLEKHFMPSCQLPRACFVA